MPISWENVITQYAGMKEEFTVRGAVITTAVDVTYSPLRGLKVETGARGAGSSHPTRRIIVPARNSRRFIDETGMQLLLENWGNYRRNKPDK